jgi:hypothetical protein
MNNYRENESIEELINESIKKSFIEAADRKDDFG